MKAQPAAAVAGFLACQHLGTLFVPSLMVAERRSGVARRPGQWRHGLEASVESVLQGATLATRNTGDFDGYRLTLMDPWQTA